jgi:oligosaccharide repeat unit polymerase
MTEISGRLNAEAARSIARNSNAPTLIMIFGLAATWLALPSDDAESIFKTAAIGVGITLLIATAMEAFSGVRALIRTDKLMLWVLYGLTFLEFLFPQPDVDAAVSVEAASRGTGAVLVGFFGLVSGRHLVSKRWGSSVEVNLTPGHLFGSFLFAFVIGYLPIFSAVDFDPIEMIVQMSGPRWSQPWGRGRYGDIYSLLYELSLLIYLLPPIGGLILARANQFSTIQKAIVVSVLTLTFYYAFASGTRNLLGTYAILMFGAYFLSKPNLKLKQVLIVGVPVTGLLLYASTLMLEFRNFGAITWLETGDRYYATLVVDHNIVNVSNLTNVFPDAVDYLGLEIPYQALIKPIPRVFWPGKPEGLSTSIEAALGLTDYATTLSCTFVGEAYMSFGFVGVLVASVLFGAAAALWNRVGQEADSPFSQLLYASGFLCAAMAMRSALMMVPFMLPTVALWIFGRYWLQRSSLHTR